MIAVGVGAAIAIGMTGDSLFKALEEFIPEQIAAIRPLAKNFSVPTLEKLLFFCWKIIRYTFFGETGHSEGGKIQVRSGRARRVSEARWMCCRI